MKTNRVKKPGLGAVLAGVAAVVVGLGGRAVRADFAFAWGINDTGELGNGTHNPNFPFGANTSPAPVLDLSGGVTAMAAGFWHSLALQNGAVYAWGNDNYDQLGVVNMPSPYNFTPVAVTGLSSGVTSVAAGRYHNLAIQNGGLYAWGNGDYDDTSNGSMVPGTFLQSVPGLSSGVTAIAAGMDYSLAVKNGGAYSWGANWHGQLGNGTTSLLSNGIPALMASLSSGVTAVAAAGSIIGITGGIPDGTWYSSAIALKNGGVYAWGYNSYGQLGNGTTTDSLVPVAVTGLSSGVTAIAAGGAFGLAVRNGGVYAWGENFNGELGDGTTTEELVPEQVDPSDLTSIVTVAASAGCGFALSSDGSIWDWGDNTYGELGLGTTTADYLTPQHLLPPNGYRFTSISGSGDGDSVLATLAAVPEPGSLLLLAAWGVALLGRRRLGGLQLRLMGTD